MLLRRMLSLLNLLAPRAAPPTLSLRAAPRQASSAPCPGYAYLRGYVCQLFSMVAQPHVDVPTSERSSQVSRERASSLVAGEDRTACFFFFLTICHQLFGELRVSCTRLWRQAAAPCCTSRAPRASDGAPFLSRVKSTCTDCSVYFWYRDGGYYCGNCPADTQAKQWLTVTSRSPSQHPPFRKRPSKSSPGSVADISVVRFLSTPGWNFFSKASSFAFDQAKFSCSLPISAARIRFVSTQNRWFFGAPSSYSSLKFSSLATSSWVLCAAKNDCKLIVNYSE